MSSIDYKTIVLSASARNIVLSEFQNYPIYCKIVRDAEKNRAQAEEDLLSITSPCGADSPHSTTNKVNRPTENLALLLNSKLEMMDRETKDAADKKARIDGAISEAVHSARTLEAKAVGIALYENLCNYFDDRCLRSVNWKTLIKYKKIAIGALAVSMGLAEISISPETHITGKRHFLS